MRRQSSQSHKQAKITKFATKDAYSNPSKTLKSMLNTQRIEKFLVVKSTTSIKPNNSLPEETNAKLLVSEESEDTQDSDVIIVDTDVAVPVPQMLPPPPPNSSSSSSSHEVQLADTKNAFHLLMQSSLSNKQSATVSISSSKRVTVTKAKEIDNLEDLSIQNSSQSSEVSANGQSSQRKCPFYKWIPDSRVTVDAFRYGVIPQCQAYLLSHFHYDHYQGLDKRFQGELYCSQVTASLVQRKLGVPAARIHALPMNTTVTVAGIDVTLLNANHCPGSVLFLCKVPLPGGSSHRIHLHTGDFRADLRQMLQEDEATTRILNQAIQSPGGVHTVLLDTTYCDPLYDFPSQNDVVNATVNLALNKWSQQNLVQTKRTGSCVHGEVLFAFGSYTIGKERLFLAVAEALDSRIAGESHKLSVLRCLEWVELERRLTSRWAEASVHVVNMGQVTQVPVMRQHLRQTRNSCSSTDPQHGECHLKKIVAFRPTGWTFQPGRRSADLVKCTQLQEDVELYEVPYSEHSSFSELKEFIQHVRPKRILPTVNNGKAHQREKMQSYFRDWLDYDLL